MLIINFIISVNVPRNECDYARLYLGCESLVYYNTNANGLNKYHMYELPFCGNSKRLQVNIHCGDPGKK